MKLVPGSSFGRYDVVSFLGEGGMGEVYRARDRELGRDVALKVLRKASSDDPDRRARLANEARMLAALNNPHIGAIYGLEESDGTRALVLELVEGPTLADRLGAGPIAPAEAITIARQIADALEAAHEKGIVHRDLKPANIKLAANGAVTVLDFGLAKVFTEPAATGELATRSALGTQEGTIIGTAAYMSPEQSRGLAVDKRTDIWAFGCVLYEMLTGRAVFARDTLTDTLAAVVGHQPPWTALPANAPPALVRLLRRCLEKDPRQRLHDIADVRLELEDAGSPTPEAQSPVAPARENSRVRTLRVAVALLAITTVAASAVALYTVTRVPDAPHPDALRFAIGLQPDEQLPLDAGLPRPLAISRDGRIIAFVARRATGNRIYLRWPDDVDPRPVAGTDGGSSPFFSPDGQWIGFASGGLLRRVPIAGGTPQDITPVTNVVGASWSDDDSIVFNEWGGGLFRAPAGGGSRALLTSVDGQRGELAHLVPHALPGGQAALFAVQHRGGQTAVEIVEFATGRRRRILDGSDPHYLSSGQIVFTRDGRVHAAPFDLARLQPSGPAVPVTGPIEVATVPGRGALAVSAGGSLAYVAAGPTASRLVWVDRNGRVRPFIDDRQQFGHPRLSPDGARVVVSVATESGDQELWVYDVGRQTRQRLSVTGISRPIWSHDGKTIAFQKDRRIYAIPADDSRPPELLLAPEPPASALFPLAWSRNGRVLVYSRPAQGTNRDVFTLSAGGTPVPFLATPRDERSAMLSPDGRTMVYAALEPGREEEVYVQPYPGPAERVVVSEGGGREPVWSPAGNEIFYRSIDGRRMMAVDVRIEPTLRVGRPRTLFEGQFRQGTFWSQYDVSPDGREFLMLEADDPVASRLEVALNWVRRPE